MNLSTPYSLENTVVIQYQWYLNRYRGKNHSAQIISIIFPSFNHLIKPLWSQKWNGSSPRVICLLAVCFACMLVFLIYAMHLCVTGHVDPSCRGSQVTMALGCYTAGGAWLVHPAVFCQVILNIRAVEWHRGALNAIYKPSRGFHWRRCLWE